MDYTEFSFRAVTSGLINRNLKRLKGSCGAWHRVTTGKAGIVAYTSGRVIGIWGNRDGVLHFPHTPNDGIMGHVQFSVEHATGSTEKFCSPMAALWATVKPR